MTPPPVLSVEGLGVAFRGERGLHRVVEDVSFDIRPGETVAVVGESGSGKSVTALSVMRLLEAHNTRMEGRILFGGRDLLSLPEREMEAVRGNEIAMIFQEPMTSLNPVMTIGAQIAEALIAHRGLTADAARAEVLRLLERVRIPAAGRRIDDYPHQLSGGMRQRVMIAMALACRPRLLIADEPTTALDVTIQAQVIELMKALQREEGMGILFITHDMGVVAEIAQRVVVMYKGRVVEEGAVAEIFAAPRHPYTRALLAAVPRLGQMADRPLPQRFALIDPETGTAQPAAEIADTVVHEGAPLLQVRDLVTRYDIASGLLRRVSARVHAVEGISFDLRAGETLALVGESGCGKSTTGRAIMRLTQALSGSVLLEGREVLGPQGLPDSDLRRAVQMIFQDPFASLNPRIPVGRSIAEPLRIHRICGAAEARERVAALMERVGLPRAMADRYPHEFSGGQRQRICIARALALRPRLIVADESVSALDVSIKAQVVNLLLDLQEEMKLAYLFISHDMAVVERVSHRVAVMYLGEIVEIGPREAVFGNPQHPYTRRLLDAVPVPDPALRRAGRHLDETEIGSPIRPVGYQPPQRHYRAVSPDHLVQVDAG